MSRMYVRTELSALAENYTFLRKKVGELYAVVKCDAYGHGLSRCVQTLYGCGSRRFAVAYPSEALRVRELAPEAEILLFGRAEMSELSELCDRRIALTVADEEYAQAVRLYKSARVHLKIETAMNRSGLRPSEIPSDIFGISGQICGAYTHFPRSDNKADTLRALKVFSEAANRIEELLGQEICKHAAASQAALSIPETRLDVSRIGIALYGVGDPRLLPVKEAEAEVVQVHVAKKGEHVGYGGAFLCEKDTVVATVFAGYADGLLRSGANRLTAKINGHEVRICGCPCMDRSMFDVTPIYDLGGKVSVGDRALFFGRGKSIERTAEECGTIPYEVMCRFLE